MKKSKIYVIIIALLIISNGFTIFLLFGRKHNHKPPFLSEQIGLSGKKLEQAKSLEESHFKQMKPIHEKIRKNQAKLFSGLGESQNHEHDSLLLEINKLEKERELKLLNHFKSLYNLCDDNEKVKLTDQINKHFSKPHHPPR